MQAHVTCIITHAILMLEYSLYNHVPYFQIMNL